ncbi:pyrroline-5-carboxylate reductase family protein [Sunxiuqinia sp. A32]|uniref:pyrroline-5-carboxylate reductase family protein n=1 Tax=Sunxiuqinia sp. A32 TaxID=3461496 RepID=UPI0040455472
METKSLGFIGGGRITKIFLQAFKNKNIEFKSITVFDSNSEVLNSLKNQFPSINLAENSESGAKQDIVFIAVHPPMVVEVLEQIKNSLSNDSIVISLAPKITIQKIQSLLPTPNIIRMIPNATSIINEGFNPVSFANSTDADKKQLILKTLEVLGKTFEVKEAKLEAYAMLSAMLPTYFWFQWDTLQKLGTDMGLNEPETKETIQETLIASIKLFFDSGMSSGEIIDLIPVKPIKDHEEEIKQCLNEKLMGLYQKIKP